LLAQKIALENCESSVLAVVRSFVPNCPSSDNLRLIRLFAKGGSGSSGVRV